MNGLFSAAAELQRVLTVAGWKSCLIGGLAVLKWGETRATQDVDFSVMVDFGREEEFAQFVLSKFAPLFPDAGDLAIVNRVLPIVVDDVAVDLGLACFPFEEEIIDRATDFHDPTGNTIATATAEDLIVMKTIAGRPIDWQDVEGMILRQGDRLDRQAVTDRLSQLSELIDPEAMTQILSLLSE